MRRKAVGKVGFVLSILLMIAMAIVSYLAFPVEQPAGELGLTLWSPNLWEIPQPFSAIANALLLIAIAFGLILFNKSNNFVHGNDLVFPAAFLVLTASNPWLTHYLETSTILAAANLLCLSILFSRFGKRGNQNSMFYLASVIGLGSMIQYAFIPYALVYLLAAALLKVIKPRETIAYLIGLVAAYWVLIGSGIIPISSFRFPEIHLINEGFTPPSDVLVMLIGIGLTMLLGAIMLFNNAVNMTGASSKARSFNKVVNFVGIASAIFMVLDFTNMTAYIATMNIAVGIQLANAFSYGSLRRPAWLAAALAAIYLGLLLVTVYI